MSSAQMCTPFMFVVCGTAPSEWAIPCILYRYVNLGFHLKFTDVNTISLNKYR